MAARDFCRRFGFPEQYIEHLSADPIQKPLIIERDGRPMEVFRWLGHGRGAPYVQAELGVNTDDVVVYGGFEDREFGPWQPKNVE